MGNAHFMIDYDPIYYRSSQNIHDFTLAHSYSSVRGNTRRFFMKGAVLFNRNSRAGRPHERQ